MLGRRLTIECIFIYENSSEMKEAKICGTSWSWLLLPVYTHRRRLVSNAVIPVGDRIPENMDFIMSRLVHIECIKPKVLHYVTIWDQCRIHTLPVWPKKRA